MADASVKLFISYSWSSPEHEKWVINLASELRSSGVDVILDKWDLREGHDAVAFMEKMVTDPEVKKVVMVCDQKYAEKADGRSGGVGTEAQIISPQIYGKVDQDRFVAVLSEVGPDGRGYLPTYYRSRIYIDLSDPDQYAKNFEQLLRWVYGKPVHVKPPLGDRPLFLAETVQTTLGASVQARRAIEAIKNDRSYADGALDEYFDVVVDNLERFRIQTEPGKEFHELMIQSVSSFLPDRNDYIDVMSAIAQYRCTEECQRKVHRLFERLIPYMDRPEGFDRWHEWDFDNFKFIIHEMFLHTLAVMLRYERFEFAGYLLRNHYLFEKADAHFREMRPFTVLQSWLSSLDDRNQKLRLNRLSLQADLLKERTPTTRTFNSLMEADLCAYLYSAFDAMRTNSVTDWWPFTLALIGFRGASFEVFLRSESAAYFDRFRAIFRADLKHFKDLVGWFEADPRRQPNFGYHRLPVSQMINVEKLGSRA